MMRIFRPGGLIGTSATWAETVLITLVAVALLTIAALLPNDWMATVLVVAAMAFVVTALWRVGRSR